MTFFKYLEQAMKESETIDFSLRVTQYEGEIAFYIHPAEKDGLTRDFVISADGTVTPDSRINYEGV